MGEKFTEVVNSLLRIVKHPSSPDVMVQKPQTPVPDSTTNDQFAHMIQSARDKEEFNNSLNG